MQSFWVNVNHQEPIILSEGQILALLITWCSLPWSRLACFRVGHKPPPKTHNYRLNSPHDQSTTSTTSTKLYPANTVKMVRNHVFFWMFCFYCARWTREFRCVNFDLRLASCANGSMPLLENIAATSTCSRWPRKLNIAGFPNSRLFFFDIFGDWNLSIFSVGEFPTDIKLSVPHTEVFPPSMQCSRQLEVQSDRMALELNDLSFLSAICWMRHYSRRLFILMSPCIVTAQLLTV